MPHGERRKNRGAGQKRTIDVRKRKDDRMTRTAMIDFHTHPMFPLDEVGKILDFMDRYSLEKIVALGLPHEPDGNERVFKLRKLAPSRIVGGPFVDPRNLKVFEELKRFSDEGCRILKLFPNYGYYPDDPQFTLFFEKAAEMGFGILSHCGWLGAKEVCSTRYAKPGRFEEVFRRFPKMLFVMAHMGGIDGFIEGIMYTTRTPNVYLDSTPGQSHWVFKHAPEFVRGMPHERLLMGTDGISPQREDGFDASAEYALQTEMLEKMGMGEFRDDIFYNNATRVIEEYKLIP
jgi:predicted TIM-barrel fold metal-dependent hydrolase